MLAASSNDTMNRRDFLTLAGGLTGYSVAVRAEGIGDRPVPSRESIAGSFEQIAPGSGGAERFAGEPHMRLVDLTTDVLVAGGGMAGVCAALAAARQGARVVLVQDRSRLGGNASSEVKMHIVGADCHGARPSWRESGLIEEIRLDDAVQNPQRSFELFDLLLYDKIRREPNVTLLLDTTVFAAQKRQDAIERVMARCDKTEHLYRIRAQQFVDCTGDCRLALEAGADFRVGREARQEHGESLAVAEADRETLGSSILFTARDYGRPIAFRAPHWARQVTKEMLQFRPVASWEYGYWWIEWGGQLDSIRDNEQIRFELLSIVLGVWDYIKNSGALPSSAHWGMDWIGFLPGKRESRRLLGDYLLTQQDLEGDRGEPEDAVAIGGWPMDDHPPSGFDRWQEPPFRSIRTKDVYSIPFRCLYSRNVSNLLMAGRNISASHVAFSSTRVMATCAVVGQAAGTAAALCIRHGASPRQLYQDKTRLRELQQTLLRDDQTIKSLRNEDEADLARQAEVTASGSRDLSRPENVINGRVRDQGNEWESRWGVAVEAGEAWLQLSWKEPRRIREVQLTFDTGLHRELTLSASDATNRRVIRGPQPETVRDYEIVGWVQGQPVTLVKVEGNWQRVRRHRFPAVETPWLKIVFHATHGDRWFRLYEVRAYA
jgi:hypothetical protein